LLVIVRTTWLAPLILALAGIGCGETIIPPQTGTGTSAEATTPPAAPPVAVNDPKPVDDAPTAPPSLPPSAVAEPAPARAEKEAKTEAAKAPAPQVESSSAGAVKLEPVKYDEFLARIAANKDAKYTLVDAWATWCGPCKENFPHLVEMHRKYAGKGLAVVSLSFDDPAATKQVEEAKEFLRDKKADFTNFLLDEAEGVGFEKLNINAIPAVFLYGPDGKLVKRFTMDDPNNQFTYDEVEKAVVALLDGKPLPADSKETKGTEAKSAPSP
jgi:thiol-disulfide isomerase/thioredoxin